MNNRLSLYFTDETKHIEKWVHDCIEKHKKAGFKDSINNFVINVLREKYEREGQSSLEKQGQMDKNANTGNGSS